MGGHEGEGCVIVDREAREDLSQYLVGERARQSAQSDQFQAIVRVRRGGVVGTTGRFASRCGGTRGCVFHRGIGLVVVLVVVVVLFFFFFFIFIGLSDERRVPVCGGRVTRGS
jgi:hypothetical protein